MNVTAGETRASSATWRILNYLATKTRSQLPSDDFKLEFSTERSVAMAPFLLLFSLLLTVSQASQRTMRVITWNVADNSRMEGSFEMPALRQVLGLEASGEQKWVHMKRRPML